MSTAFWILLALGAYPYVIYPGLVAIVARLWPRSVRSGAVTPRVTVIISAYNEVAHVERTVRNKLEQDYPAELLDVLVASDGSTDGTDDVLARLAAENPRLKFFRQEPRAGKTAALNRLVEKASGDIVVFSDANSMYRNDTLRELVKPFADPQVGYVSGRMIYVNPDGSVIGDGCSTYMRHENWLRSQETLLGSIVGVDGGVDAIRRSLYEPMTADQLPDFVLPLKVVGRGFRVVFEPRAHLTEDALSQSTAEFKMRVRVSLRAFWALHAQARLLNPFRTGLFAWQLWSHKVLRYLSFAPLAVACLIGVLLATQSTGYAVLAAAQLLFWVAVWAGWRGSSSSVGRLAYYFTLLNVASAVAFFRFIRGQKQVLWQPRMG